MMTLFRVLAIAACVGLFVPSIKASSHTAALPTPPANETEARPYFLKKGDAFFVSSRDALDLHETLPVGTYTVQITPMGEYYLKSIDSFTVTGKVYGETPRQSERIIRTFLARHGSTGVLLTGVKGSGKTFLAKYISIQVAKKGIPTIVINRPLRGESFNTFIQSIRQPCVVLFDEFEKIYSPQADEARYQRQVKQEEMFNPEFARSDGMTINQNQDAMLTLLDGVYQTKMLFLLTSNDKSQITTNLQNRPGRIYYVLDFVGLDTEFIEAYCKDNLKHQHYVHQVAAIATLFENFNFDMLQAVVQEMNLYEENPYDVLKWLNVRPEMAGVRPYEIERLTIGGTDIELKDIRFQHTGGNVWIGHPLRSTLSLMYKKPKSEEDNKAADGEHHDVSREPIPVMMDDDEMYYDERGSGEKWVAVGFTSSNHLQGMNAKTGLYTYYNPEEKAMLVLQRRSSVSEIDFEHVILYTNGTVNGTKKDTIDADP